MKALTYTLVADGPSDRCLTPIINWVLARASPNKATLFVDSQFADYRDTPNPPIGLTERIRRAYQDLPCDVLFVHRDAEKEDPANRRTEILDSAREVGVEPVMCVIPVRMMEAWLLFDEAAIRRAAGNPNGSADLNLPPLQRVESIPDPKAVLQDALVAASEATGRRLKQFRRDLPMLKLRVAELIEDFSPLRRLRAFATFEREVQELLSRF